MGEMGAVYKVRHKGSGTVQDVGALAWRELEAGGEWELVRNEPAEDAYPRTPEVRKAGEGEWWIDYPDGNSMGPYKRRKDAVAAMGTEGLPAEDQNEANEAEAE